jgi:hypothetical protein
MQLRMNMRAAWPAAMAANLNLNGGLWHEVHVSG